MYQSTPSSLSSVDTQITQEALSLLQLYSLLSSSPSVTSSVLDALTQKVTAGGDLEDPSFTYFNHQWDNDTKIKLRSSLSQIYTNRGNMNKHFLTLFSESGYSDVCVKTWPHFQSAACRVSRMDSSINTVSGCYNVPSSTLCTTVLPHRPVRPCHHSPLRHRLQPAAFGPH